MKIGFLYGGQGSQQEKMGKDIYESYGYIKDFYNNLNLNFNIMDFSFNKNIDIISKTEYTQPIMVAFQIAITKVLITKNIIPIFLAGLSIGEYSALVAAGVLKDIDAVKIAEFRGREMSKASENIETGMLAVIGLSLAEIEKTLKLENDNVNKVEISNLNCPGQIVISGEKNKLEKISKLLKEKGARKIIALNVSGPFHTSYMKPVSKKLESYFLNYNFNDEKTPIVYNLLGKTKGVENIKDIMTKQVMSTVKFQESIEFMINKGVDTFIEIGFGNVLKGFVKKVDKNIKVYTVNNLETINEIEKVIINE